MDDAVRDEQRRRRAVLLVWLLATIGALALVYCYASDAPFADEWAWVDTVSGAKPLTLGWFFESENHHRMPLAKLFYVGLGWLTDYDFRGAAYAVVAILSVASLALIRAIRAARGETRLADVILPLCLLHLGHWYNLIWGHQIFFAMSAAEMCALLCLILSTRGRQMTIGCAVATALVAVAMTASGGPSVCFVPAVAAWLACAAVARMFTNAAGGCAAGCFMLLLAVGCLALVPCYFAGNSPTQGLPTESSGQFAWGRVESTALGAVQVMTISAGRIGRDLWPVSGLLVVAAVAAAALVVARVAFRDKADRVCALGLGCFLLAIVCVGLGIGWSRGMLEPRYCLTPRYTTLSCPLVAGLYVVCILYGPRLRRAWADHALAIVSLGFGVAYVSTGAHQAAEVHARLARMEGLVLDGYAPEAIAMRCCLDVQDDEASLVRHLEEMRQAGIGPYRYAPDPAPVLHAHIRAVVADQSPDSKQRATIELPAGQAWKQTLPCAAGEELFRVDVRVRNRLHRAPLVAALDWTLVEQTATGETHVKAQGQCSLAELDDPMFAHLRFTPFTTVRGASYSLTLQPVAGPSEDRLLKLPAFARDGSERTIDGYVYTSSGRAPTSIAAQPTGKLIR